MASQTRSILESLQDEILTINPPLLNSSCPWASTYADLKLLYSSHYTGAVTTRTSMLCGFAHDKHKHQHLYFDINGLGQSEGQTPAQSITNVSEDNTDIAPRQTSRESEVNCQKSTLNTYGYSPIPFDEYLEYIRRLWTERREVDVNQISTTPGESKSKLIIVSVTGTPSDIADALRALISLSREQRGLNLAMEVNLSCPNINDKPPPAYDEDGLMDYLQVLKGENAHGDGVTTDTTKSTSSSTNPSASKSESENKQRTVKVGFKLPPYTYRRQFDMVVRALKQVTRPGPSTSINNSNADVDVDGHAHDTNAHHRPQQTVLDFITTTNTLGSSIVYSYTTPGMTTENDAGAGAGAGACPSPSLSSESGTGIGGMAGAAIHPLSLGNVLTLRNLLDLHPETKNVLIIGVGGVEDHHGFARMKGAGAGAVAVASALGREGVGVFEKIYKGRLVNNGGGRGGGVA